MRRVSFEMSIGQMFWAGVVRFHISSVEIVHELQDCVNTSSKRDVKICIECTNQAKSKHVLRCIVTGLLVIIILRCTPFFSVCPPPYSPA
jgi:hypothetical protein